MMTISTYTAIFLTLAALIMYVNHRFIRMQPTIAMMAAALLISLLLLLLSKFGLFISQEKMANFIMAASFDKLVMNFMLGMLLFAGALTINLTDLKEQKIEIMTLTVLGTIASALLVAGLSYTILDWLGLHLDFIYCMLFGSLISPTDPIAVLAIFKQLGAPKRLETIVAAESLFNDGVGIVLFITVYKLAFVGVSATTSQVVGLFLQEAAGGVLYGLVLGWITYWLLHSVDEVKIAILLTLATAFGGYNFAQSIGISGPLAMVTTGIFLANYKRKELTSGTNRKQLNNFWELIEELLNAVLFLFLGLELLAIKFGWADILAAILMIPAVLLVRYITVALPITIMRPWRQHIPHTIRMLTWGGLRGGLAVALALSIPAGPIKHTILCLTYAVVLFSILVQGTTITCYVKRAFHFQKSD